MWLTDVSIRRPVFITMIVLALIVMGWMSRGKMPAELEPKIDFPYITIVTVYPGAGPQEIETLVSQPVEEAVGSVGNLRNVTSTSQDGLSVVAMELELGTNLDAAAADVRDKLSGARGNLPRDINEPIVNKLDITSQPVMTMAVKGNLSGRDLRILADNTIKDALSKVGGVASVTVNGGQVREIAVAIDRDRLQAYGLSIDQVAQSLAAQNLNLPSGSIKEGPNGYSARAYAVRTVGEFKSADEISNTRITVSRNGQNIPIRLGDIAKITDTVQEPDVLTRLNGEDSVVFAVQKQSDANTIDVANGIREELKLLNGYKTPDGQPVKGILPEGTQVIIATDQSVFVKDSLDDVTKALLEGILLVILVVFVFLHSGRATAIVALAIPTSLIATFLPMWIFGFTLNFITLLALALCVGILVDDSIVVLENIERHVRRGEAPRKAALTGRSEIGLAAVTITLVDVVVFIPIAFMQGIVGQFFKQFGITVAVATLFSLFMSFTLTPMLASRWLRSKEEEEAREVSNDGRSNGGRKREGFFARLFAGFERIYTGLDHGYRGVLGWALDNRALTIAIGAMSLLVVVAMLMPMPDFGKSHAVQAAKGAGASGPPLIEAYMPRLVIALLTFLIPLVVSRRGSRRVALAFSGAMVLLVLFVRFPFGFEMMPDVDQGQYSISVELPAGSGLDATNQVTKRIEAILASPEQKKITDYYQTTAGSSSGGIMGAGDSGPQYAQIAVQLVDRMERTRTVKDVVDEVNAKTALIPGAIIRVSAQSGMGGGGGQPLQMEITGPNMDDLVRVASKAEAAMNSIPGVVDVKNSWDVGKPELRVTVDRDRAADYGMSVAQIATALRTSIEGNNDAKFRDQGDQYDIRVRLAKFDRTSDADVSNLIVGQRNGSPVYLRDVAKVAMAAAPNKIDRKNRQRLITVGANIGEGYSLGNVQQQVQQALAKIPLGSARVTTGGVGEIMLQSFGYMLASLLLAIVLVYMLMGALFESFITPLTIMVSLPQAMVGALFALMLTGNTMSIVTMIGIIMLVGLVTKNAILLVDYTNTLRSRGYKRREAILEAGPTRLRPILMTTVAMIGGMAPTALALSRGSEQRSPMAIAVIGGLILSTMLTLLVIPTVYTIFDDWTTAVKRLLGLQHVAGQDQLSLVAEEERKERALLD